MRPSTRDRLVLPILLPLGIVGGIALSLWGFSRLLLGVHGEGATVIAIVVAAGIVIVAAVAAGRPTVRGSTIAAMAGATVGVAMLAGGIALAVVGGGEGEEEGREAIRLVAQNLAFEPTNLTVPAAEPFTIAFDNRDGAQHNVAIFDNEEHAPPALFEGALIAGPAETSYAVDPLQAGTYSFLCTVHPDMTGQIEAVEGGGGLTVSARNLAFDTEVIELPADTPATLTFDNADPGQQHNISIYPGPDLGEPLFEGELIAAPDTIEYPIPPQPAGEYYFRCDIHPDMNGTVRVA